MPNLSVTHQTGDRFQLQVRGHRLTCDQPSADGGDDQGPTPTELFVGSLAACVAFKVTFMVCEMGLRAIDLTPADLRDDLPYQEGGIVSFLADASATGATIFI